MFTADANRCLVHLQLALANRSLTHVRRVPMRGGAWVVEMCSGSEAGSYLRRIDFVYHSTLGVRVIKKNKESLY